MNVLGKMICALLCAAGLEVCVAQRKSNLCLRHLVAPAPVAVSVETAKPALAETGGEWALLSQLNEPFEILGHFPFPGITGMNQQAIAQS
jgi:hypothetical protein